MLLDDIKTILGITDTSKDSLLAIYIRKGATLIVKYMNSPASIPVEVEAVYADALIEYVTLCYRKRGNEGVKSFGQGSRSGTYEDSLQQSVKDLLPSPYIRMRG